MRAAPFGWRRSPGRTALSVAAWRRHAVSDDQFGRRSRADHVLACVHPTMPHAPAPATHSWVRHRPPSQHGDAAVRADICVTSGLASSVPLASTRWVYGRLGCAAWRFSPPRRAPVTHTDDRTAVTAMGAPTVHQTRRVHIAERFPRLVWTIQAQASWAVYDMCQRHS